jgi:hypothetical protein
MRANQLRLWFATMGYALLCALRRIGLTHPQLIDQARRDELARCPGPACSRRRHQLW